MLQQPDVLQLGLGLDLFKRHRPFQGPDRGQFDGRPIAFCRCGIAECFPRDLGHAYHGLPIHAMIVKYLIAELHRSKIIARLKVPHPGPVSFPVRDELVPGVRCRFLLYQPVLSHIRWIPREAGRAKFHLGLNRGGGSARVQDARKRVPTRRRGDNAAGSGREKYRLGQVPARDPPRRIRQGGLRAHFS